MRTAALPLLLLLACSRPEAAEGTRIVSLVPSVTETLAAIGAENTIVAACRECDHPKAGGAGLFAQPNLEAIAAIRPDVVFVTLPVHARAAETLRGLGLRVVEVSPESVEDIIASVRLVGKEAGRAKAADSLARYLEEQVVQRPRTGLKAYVEIGRDPFYTAGSGTFVDELLALAGLENVFGDSRGYFPVNAEEVVKRSPELVVLSCPGASLDEFRSRVGFGPLSGAKVAVIDPDILNRPGPSFPLAVKALAEAAR